MASKKQRKNVGTEQLERVIALCKSVEARSLDPFVVEVDDMLAVIREYFPDWELPEELCLDAEAIQQLSSVIKLQSDWVKHRSTSLYTDPFLLEEKIQRLGKDVFATLFLKSWHPIIELEQLSPQSLAEAVKYWQDLLPIEDRWPDLYAQEVETEATTRQELIEQRLIRDEAFSEELEAFWDELKRRVHGQEKIRYWDFVGADAYSDTVWRAFMMSFLVTYGYATLEIDRLEEEIYIKPFETPISYLEKRQVMSVPVSIDFEEWNKWRQHDG